MPLSTMHYRASISKQIVFYTKIVNCGVRRTLNVHPKCMFSGNNVKYNSSARNEKKPTTSERRLSITVAGRTAVRNRQDPFFSKRGKPRLELGL